MKSFKTIIKGIALGTMLSAFFLFPLLEQKFSQKFWVDFILPVDGANFLLHYRYSLVEIFNSMFCYSNISYGIIPLLLMIIFYIRDIFFLKTRNIKRDILFFVILFSSLLVWDKVDLTSIPFMYVFQFSWRFLPIIYFIVIYFDCELINNKYNNSLMKIVFIFLLCLYSLTYFIHVYNYDKISNDFDILSIYTDDKLASEFDNIDTIRLVRGEYLPYTNFYDYYHAFKEIVFANEEPYLYDYNRVGTTISFHTNLNYDENVYMPLSWYKGYYYQELDKNNNVINEIECFPNEYNKRVGIKVTSGEHNYKVYYKGTFIQKVSMFLSLLTLLYILKNRKNIFYARR